MDRLVQRHFDLEVYQTGFAAAMEIFRISQTFPPEERYSLTDQMRRSSRSVCSNLAEAWRNRRYPGAFVAKLTHAEGEAAETQTWLQFAVECGYLSREQAIDLYKKYDQILGMLVTMATHADQWKLPH